MTDCEDCDGEIDMTDVKGHYSGKCYQCRKADYFDSLKTDEERSAENADEFYKAHEENI